MACLVVQETPGVNEERHGENFHFKKQANHDSLQIQNRPNWPAGCLQVSCWQKEKENKKTNPLPLADKHSQIQLVQPAIASKKACSSVQPAY